MSHTQGATWSDKGRRSLKGPRTSLHPPCPLLDCPWVPLISCPRHMDFCPLGKVAPWGSHRERKAFPGISFRLAVLGTQNKCAGRVHITVTEYKCSLKGYSEAQREQARRGHYRPEAPVGYWAKNPLQRKYLAPGIWKDPQRLAQPCSALCRNLLSGTPTTWAWGPHSDPLSHLAACSTPNRGLC